MCHETVFHKSDSESGQGIESVEQRISDQASNAQQQAALQAVSKGWRILASFLVEAGRDPLQEKGGFVNPPLERGSTVLFPTMDDLRTQGGHLYDHELIYGAMGSPIQHRLERIIADIEGGSDTQIVCSGLAACVVPLLTFLAHGGHCLLPDNVYGPTRRFANTMLKRFGVSTTYYPPMASMDELTSYIKPHTHVIFAESPGSHTFEVQDIPAIAEVAHAHGAKLILDNTWGIGIFKPFQHGVDVSIQALTKYPAGHSDVIMGAVTVNDAEDWKSLRDAAIQLGQMADPEACWMTLRGLRTMPVRLAQQSQSAYKVALWFAQQNEVEQVLHPAFENSPGHLYWKRDFTGASSLFGVVFKENISAQNVEEMVNALTRFGIGASWGGYESLVLPTTGTITRTADASLSHRTLCRFHIGLENHQDLIEDLAQAWCKLS